MAKGGTKTTKPYMPTYGEEDLQRGLGAVRDVSTLMGTYTPQYGPQVASESPYTRASQQSVDMMASAFGMPTAGGQSYLPQEEVMGGVRGYSSRPMTEGLISQFREERPAQSQYITSFGMDPVTGEVGSRALENQEVGELELQGGKGGK